MLYRRRALIAFVLAALSMLGAMSAVIGGSSSSTGATAANSVDMSAADSERLAAVQAAMSDSAEPGSMTTVEPDHPIRNTHRPVARGTVHTLRAVCAGTGVLVMRLTDDTHAVETRLTCSATARERRSIQLTATTTSISEEFESIDGAAGLVGTEIVVGPLSGSPGVTP
jgi:hypothetical protein